MEWTRGPVIGRGSTATVSLATSIDSGELFALKSADLSKSHFLQREQCILSSLSSPYVVKYIGSSVSEHNCIPTFNVCMEYAAAGTLSDLIRLRGGRLLESEIRAAASRILKGLDYLHGNGLVHCDIKAQNLLLVDESEGVKIGDFGSSGIVSGTPAFMAPEVARGEEQGFAADIWAVGCTVIEMASGRNPWAESGSDDPVSALYRIGFSDDSPDVPSWLSEEAIEFVAKCLIKDHRERWTVKQLLDHPFLAGIDESIELKEVVTRSPSCVLDQGFWDSMDGLDSPRNRTTDEVRLSGSGAGDRMKKLISSNSGSWNPEEEEEEEGWMTVRSNVESEDASLLLCDRSIIVNSEEEIGSLDSDEELFLTELELAAAAENVIISTRDDFVTGKDDVDGNSNDHTLNLLCPQISVGH
ncbi:Mitogen-activated protein kinase kinase kinase 17 [Linum perenne]